MSTKSSFFSPLYVINNGSFVSWALSRISRISVVSRLKYPPYFALSIEISPMILLSFGMISSVDTVTRGDKLPMLSSMKESLLLSLSEKVLVRNSLLNSFHSSLSILYIASLPLFPRFFSVL